jgi:hypothetical protein
LIARVKKLIGQALVGVICAVTPRCREMTRLISAEREEPLSWFTRLRMRWHYRICVWCARYRDQIGLMGRLSRTLDNEFHHGTHARLSDESKEKLKQALSRHSHD